MCSISFLLGKRHSDMNTFERGAKLERERSALYIAAQSNYLVKLFDAGKTDQLRKLLENGMWTSIVRMDDLLNSADATAEDRKRVGNVLPRIVAYYYEHPKVIENPERSEISDGVDQRLKDKENSVGIDPTEREILGDLREATKGPMKQLDGMFDAVLDAVNKFDLETQEVLTRHISQRNFPGRTRSAAGITFKMPNDSGGGGSSDDEFHFNGKKLRVLYENGKLRVNDQGFGSIAKGDTVDLRLLGHVFVNDVERHPENQEAEQEAEQAVPSDGHKPSNRAPSDGPTAPADAH